MIKTILEISKTLEENNIEYFLTGSCSLFLRKKIKDLKNIDFSIKEKDLKKAKEAFKEERLLMSNKKTISFYKDGFQVELLLISEKTDTFSHKILENKTYEIINIQKQNVKTISLKELLSMYRFVYLRDGKEKHLERIKFLENLIKNK